MNDVSITVKHKYSCYCQENLDKFTELMHTI